MDAAPVQPLTISHVKKNDFDAAFEFHQGCVGEYLWPRSRDEFEGLVRGYNVFSVTEGGKVVGLGYLTKDHRPEGSKCWEFGGMFLAKKLRGLGLAAAMGRVVISTIYITDEPDELIAHVHESNKAPRQLLGELGFENTGIKEDVHKVAPPTMKHNDDGKVIGEVFRFRRQALRDIADWLASFDGTLNGSDGTQTSLIIDLEVWKGDRSKLLNALRDRADAQ